MSFIIAMVRDLAKCPSCGARSSNVVKSFDVQAEPEDDKQVKYLPISILQCERCGLEFPRLQGKRYTLVAKNELDKVLDEAMKLREANTGLERELDNARVKNEELKKSVIEVEQVGMIQVLEERVNVLEDEVSYLRVEKEELEKVINFITDH